MAEQGIDFRSCSSQARTLPTLLLSVWHQDSVTFLLDKSDDNDSPHKGYINDGEKKMQLLLLFQVVSTFCLQLWSTCKSASRKSCIFLITLPLIKCKCHLCLHCVAYAAKARSQQYCSYLLGRFYSITPLSQDNFISPCVILYISESPRMHSTVVN